MRMLNELLNWFGQASTTYSFYVRAYTQSASDPSRRFFFTTPADTESAGVAAPAASTAPNVTLVPLSPTSLKVSWPPVASEASRRPVSLYKIQYRRHQSNEFDIEVVRGWLPSSFSRQRSGRNPFRRNRIGRNWWMGFVLFRWQSGVHAQRITSGQEVRRADSTGQPGCCRPVVHAADAPGAFRRR